jgi:NADPH:quinone reductase-like Zn-dependent oxidoreductase
MKLYIIVVTIAILAGRQLSMSLSTVDWPSASKSKHEKMRALVYETHGDVEVLKLKDDVPRPVPREDQVLIRVHASALNPVDFKVRRNPVPDFIVPKPKISGQDLAGVVVATGKKVTKFRVGDRVAAMMPLLGSSWGAMAEYAAVRESHTAKMGDTIDYEGAASLPLVALTAVQKLQLIPNPKDKKILVHAGAGGVGTIAIQYAKHVLGMFVATTTSAQKSDFVKSLGADVVIDYREVDFVEEIVDYDAVLDPMSYLYETKTLNSESRVLRRDGMYLNILSSDWSLVNGQEKSNGPELITNLIYHKVMNLVSPGSIPEYYLWPVQPDGETLQHILDLVEEGKIKPVIDTVLEWTNVVEAYKKLEGGRVSGKVVLRHMH